MIVWILGISLIVLCASFIGVNWWRYYDISLQCEEEFGEHSQNDREWNRCMRANGFDIEDPKEPEPYKPFWKAEIPERQDN